MVEDTAPEGLSSPHTKALFTSTLIVGTSFWANMQGLKAKTASPKMQAFFIVIRLTNRWRPSKNPALGRRHEPTTKDLLFRLFKCLNADNSPVTCQFSQ